MSIWIAGDIHGYAPNWQDVVDQIPDADKNTKIILCGDVGLEYGEYINGQTKKLMKKFPGEIIVLRGNHDNRYWRDHYDDPKWHIEGDYGYAYGEYLVQDKYPNIKYINDVGGVYYIDGYHFLMIPGAYSIDKYYRIQNNYSYEPFEQLTKAEMRDIEKKVYIWRNKIDYVVSHTAPRHLEPWFQYLFINNIDQGSVDKTMEKWMDEIAWELEHSNNFKHWYFGHFHADIRCGDKYSMLYKIPQKIGE